jgi:hypothetical protein
VSLPLVADIDFASLDELDRNTLEQIIPALADGDSEDEVAAELGIDRQELERRRERLAASCRALSGLIDLPELSEEEYATLRDSIAAHGQLEPIVRAGGFIVDGRARLRICRELQLQPKTVELDVSADQRQGLRLVINLARRQLTAGLRRAIAAAELTRDPSRSDRAIAVAVGVSHPFVAKVRRQLEQDGQLETVSSRVGRDHVERRLPPAEPEPPPPIDETGSPRPAAAHHPAPVEPEQDDEPAAAAAAPAFARVPAELVDQAGSWVPVTAVRLVPLDLGYRLEIKP